MERETLVMQYRELDRDIALFYRKFSGSGRADYLHLIPNLENILCRFLRFLSRTLKIAIIVTIQPLPLRIL